MALKLARHIRLPGGQNAVSYAALLDRMLALDSAGALFLSHDAGQHWEIVAPQWSGKAISVLAPVPLVPPMLFRLVNERHETWVSADGKVWHKQ
jgi:hypothetical protein